MHAFIKPFYKIGTVWSFLYCKSSINTIFISEKLVFKINQSAYLFLYGNWLSGCCENFLVAALVVYFAVFTLCHFLSMSPQTGLPSLFALICTAQGERVDVLKHLG